MVQPYCFVKYGDYNKCYINQNGVWTKPTLISKAILFKNTEEITNGYISHRKWI